MTIKSNVAVLLSLIAGLECSLAMGQVQTLVPPVIPGAKPVTVEHIKVHGAALEGNLEGDAVDRDVLVFLPPGYAKSSDAIPWSMPYTATRSAPSSGPTRSTSHRRSKALRPGRARDDRRAARLEDRPQRLDVFELHHDRRLRALHRARRCRVHRRSLPNDSRTDEPRPGRASMGGLRRHAHRHETSRRVRQLSTS